MLVYFFGSANRLYPSGTAETWGVWAKGVAPTRDAAVAQFSEAKKKSLAFLATLGVSPKAISFGDFQANYIKDERTWTADQEIIVAGSYRELSTDANAFATLETRDPRITAGFPEFPFSYLLGCLCLFVLATLSVSVASLEFRDATVTAPPKGMRLVVLFSQALMAAWAILLTQAYFYTNATSMRWIFIATETGMVGMLALWLVSTRVAWKQTRFLAISFWLYVVSVALVVSATGVALAYGPR